MTSQTMHGAIIDRSNMLLREHVAEIRRLGKRVVGDVVEIGRHLTECQKIVGHGHWLDWLDAEFGWSDRTALNLMRVYEMAAKSENFSDLNLPISALYLLAAPSTPPEAKDEILQRAEAGEAIDVADVKQVIKRLAPPKTATAARQITEPKPADRADDPQASAEARKKHYAGDAPDDPTSADDPPARLPASQPRRPPISPKARLENALFQIRECCSYNEEERMPIPALSREERAGAIAVLELGICQLHDLLARIKKAPQETAS